MSNKEKRPDGSPPSRKKFKRSPLFDSDLLDLNDRSAELLSKETIREGMVILGCVTEIRKSSLVISLPGYLIGTVPIINISDGFTESLMKWAENPELPEASVCSFIQPGMVFPCKVMKIEHFLKRKPSIVLSINPRDVNKGVELAHLCEKMVLYASVCSVEDHVYIVDIGTDRVRAFLSKHECSMKDQVLNVGEVIPTFVKKIDSSGKVKLSLLAFNEEFPEVSDKVRLHTILPGAKVRGDVIEVQYPFVFMKFQHFNACASVLSLGSSYKTVDIGHTITGTVLYVHPITKMIYLMLNVKPSPDIYAEYFGLKKYNIVENLKYQYSNKDCAYFKINRGVYGFVYKKELPSPKSDNPAVPRACVISLHYMDNLVQMTTNPSLFEKNILLEDVQIGDIYEGVVRRHEKGGMFIQISPGVFGFVRKILMSDVVTRFPEDKFPIRSKVRCRVISVSQSGQLSLTCKESLLQLQSQYILSSYEHAQKGQFYKGVIVKKTEEFILVLFFNDVKGIAPASYIPEGSFYEGQVVLCEVVKCNPKIQRLVISLKTAGLSSKEKPLSDVSRSNQSAHSNNYSRSGGKKKVKAKIISKKQSQLNIQMGELKGRVHITEVGCSSENIYPLQEFSVGQEIEVFIFGEYGTRKRNYSEITHVNMVSYKECTLNWPPFSLSLDLKPCDTVIGFVKQVQDAFTVLWLSPTQTGILDFLHFSDDLKVVRKLKQHLKNGLSVKASVLEYQQHSGSDGNQSITLTKIDVNMPQVGKNILALVQVACPEKGLILKLPFGYHGTVAFTDLSDVYISAQEMLDKYRKLKFLKCCVLEVNHEKMWCQLSLRKSKVYGEKIANSNICPEITEDCIKEGMIVKGFVKSVTSSGITVELGRSLEGIVKVHSCKTPDCGLCEIEKNTLDKYLVGSVIEVSVKQKSAHGKLLVLCLTDCQVNQMDSGRARLDIHWDEME